MAFTVVTIFFVCLLSRHSPTCLPTSNMCLQASTWFLCNLLRHEQRRNQRSAVDVIEGASHLHVRPLRACRRHLGRPRVQPVDPGPAVTLVYVPLWAGEYTGIYRAWCSMGLSHEDLERRNRAALEPKLTRRKDWKAEQRDYKEEKKAMRASLRENIRWRGRGRRSSENMR